MIPSSHQQQPNRRLIRPTSTSPHTTANIIGTIPTIAYNTIQKHQSQSSPLQQTTTTTTTKTSCTALIDPHSTLIALISPPNTINLFHHHHRTLTEPLLPPPSCQTYNHPECPPFDDNNNPHHLTSSLVSLVPSSSDYSSSRTLFITSPHGVIAYWNHTTTTTVPGPCHAHVRLPLAPNEHCTISTPLRKKYSCGIYVATSSGAVWEVCRQTHPLRLRAREVTGRNEAREDGGSFDWLRRRLSLAVEDNRETDDGDGGRGIMGLVAAGDKEDGSFATLNERWELNTWRCSNEEMTDGDQELTMTSTVDIDAETRAVIADELQTSEGDIVLTHLRSHVSDDNSRLLLAIRATIKEDHRLYLLYVTMDTHPPRLLHCLYLSRYPSQMSQTLSCLGLTLTTSPKAIEINPTKACPDLATALFQNVTEITTVISTVHFPPRPLHPRRWEVTFPPTPVLSSGFLPGGMAIVDVSDGVLLISASGCIVQYRVALDDDERRVNNTRVGYFYGEGGGGVVEEEGEKVRSLADDLVNGYERWSRSEDGMGEWVSPSVRGVVKQPRVLDMVVMEVSNRLFRGVVPTEGIMRGDVWERRLELLERFVRFLIVVGLYKILRQSKWRLLDRGQRMHAVKSLVENLGTMTSSDESKSLAGAFLDDITLKQHEDDDCCNIIKSLSNIETFSLDESNNQSIQAFGLLLSHLFGQSVSYREESKDSVYDLYSRDDAYYVRPWTGSEESSRNLIKRYFRRHYVRAGYAKGIAEELKVLVNVLLESYHDQLAVGSSSSLLTEEERASYDDAKMTGVDILTKYHPESAMETCIKHRYYHGLLKICHDNNDIKTIESLLTNHHFDDDDHNDANDSSSSSPSFSQYVLKWHADRQLYHHVLNLGRYTPPSDLNHILHSESTSEELRQLAWINDIRNGQFNDATSHLVDVGKVSESVVDVTFFYSMAKLSSLVVAEEETKETEETTNEEKVYIDDQLTLIRARELLLGHNDDADDDAKTLSAAELFERAMTQLTTTTNNTTSDDDNINAALCALAIAAILNRTGGGLSRTSATTARVWKGVIEVERETWKSIQSMKSFSDEDVKRRLRETLFFRVMETFVRSATEKGRQSEMGGGGSEDLREGWNESVRELVCRSGGGGADDWGELLRVTAGLAFDDVHGVDVHYLGSGVW